jgi:hypothetical protein
MIGIARVRVLPQGSVQFDKAHDRSFLKNFTLEKAATNRGPGRSCFARGAASGPSSHPRGQKAHRTPNFDEGHVSKAHP